MHLFRRFGTQFDDIQIFRVNLFQMSIGTGKIVLCTNMVNDSVNDLDAIIEQINIRRISHFGIGASGINFQYSLM